MNIIIVYSALIVVTLIHEIGHLPESIKWRWGIIPGAAAMRARSRYGGLIANALLFTVIFYFKPESLFLQVIGLVAWVHFVIYCSIGGFVPEKNPRNVNVKTYVFDDVPNKYGILFLGIGILSFLLLNNYYQPIIRGLF